MSNLGLTLLTIFASALIVAIPATISAVASRATHRQVKVPNGDTLGDIADYLHRRNHDLMNNQTQQYALTWLSAQQLSAIGKALGAEMPEMPAPARLATPDGPDQAVEDLRHRSGLDR